MQPVETAIVSVIVPVYNVQRYLEQCVKSVLVQTFAELELILVDDGSPDESGAVADAFAAQDPRVTVIHQENQGLSGARNAGLERARGEYVVFLDSDDFWDGDESLEQCLAALRARPQTDVLFFDVLRFYEATGERLFRERRWNQGRISGASSAEGFRYMVEIGDVRPSACAMLIRRKFLLDNHLWFRRGIYSEDVEWFLRLVTVKAIYDYLPLPFYMYRRGRVGSITNTIGCANVEDLLDTVYRSSRDITSQNVTPELRDDYLSYCFYQFTIALGFYGGLSRLDRRVLRPKIEQARFLLDYHRYGHSRFVARVARLLGLPATAGLLHVFLKLRGLKNRRRR